MFVGSSRSSESGFQRGEEGGNPKISQDNPGTHRLIVIATMLMIDVERFTKKKYAKTRQTACPNNHVLATYRDAFSGRFSTENIRSDTVRLKMNHVVTWRRRFFVRQSATRVSRFPVSRSNGQRSFDKGLSAIHISCCRKPISIRPMNKS